MFLFVMSVYKTEGMESFYVSKTKLVWVKVTFLPQILGYLRTVDVKFLIFQGLIWCNLSNLSLLKANTVMIYFKGHITYVIYLYSVFLLRQFQTNFIFYTCICFFFLLSSFSHGVQFYCISRSAYWFYKIVWRFNETLYVGI